VATPNFSSRPARGGGAPSCPVVVIYGSGSPINGRSLTVVALYTRSLPESKMNNTLTIASQLDICEKRWGVTKIFQYPTTGIRSPAGSPLDPRAGSGTLHCRNGFRQHCRNSGTSWNWTRQMGQTSVEMVSAKQRGNHTAMVARTVLPCSQCWMTGSCHRTCGKCPREAVVIYVPNGPHAARNRNISTYQDQAPTHPR
jgi:hypothetical protein